MAERPLDPRVRTREGLHAAWEAFIVLLVCVNLALLLFERKVGTTPKSYIRQRKLEQIHGRLSDPSAKVRNITEIAMDYGFMHLGRFSESYKSTFGELPSDTLRRHH